MDYKDEEPSLPGKNWKSDLNLYDPKTVWINDFVTQFASNFESGNPELAYDIYLKYKKDILDHSFENLPSIVYTDQFLSILEQMLDPNFEHDLLCASMEILERFYFSQDPGDFDPFKRFFIRIQYLITDSAQIETFDSLNETIDSIFRFLANVIKSQEINDFIYALFPIEYLKTVYESDSNDLLESISILANAYSKYKIGSSYNNPLSPEIQTRVDNLEEYGKMLEFCVQLFQDSIRKDRDGNQYQILERISYQRSFDSILSICMNVSDNFKNRAAEFLYENDIICLFNEILFSDHDCINLNLLRLIHFMFKNVKLIPTNQSFEALLGHSQEDLKIPRIDYTCFITILNQYEEYLDNYEILVLSLKILYCDIYLNHYDERFFQYMFEKNLMQVINVFINDSPHKLKIYTLSFLTKLLPYMPIFLIEQLLELEIPFAVIEYLDIGEPSITSSCLKCLHSFVMSLNKHGIPIDPIVEAYQTKKDDFDIPESAKDDLVNLEVIIG